MLFYKLAKFIDLAAKFCFRTVNLAKPKRSLARIVSAKFKSRAAA
ncbi:hypothetical protein [uncultured Campylobacter sp.]|nr:hypothetical protein [uncultured Campylobacter sp.]